METGFEPAEPIDAPDRREALKKIAAGAAVAWVAPTVLSLDSQAAAASGPTCALCAQGELLVQGLFPPTGFTIIPGPPAGTFTPPATYTSLSPDLNLIQRVEPVDTSNCAGKIATFRFTLTAPVSFAWTATIDSDIGNIATGGGPGAPGLLSVSGPLVGTEAWLMVNLRITALAAPPMTVTSPSLTVACL